LFYKKIVMHNRINLLLITQWVGWQTLIAHLGYHGIMHCWGWRQPYIA